MVPRCQNKSLMEPGDKEGRGSARAAVPRAVVVPLQAHSMLEKTAGNGLSPVKATVLRRERGTGCARSSRGAGERSTPAELRPGGERNGEERCEGLGGQRTSGFPGILTEIPICPVREDHPLRESQPRGTYLPGTAVTNSSTELCALPRDSWLGRSRMGEAGDFPCPQPNGKHRKKK